MCRSAPQRTATFHNYQFNIFWYISQVLPRTEIASEVQCHIAIPLHESSLLKLFTKLTNRRRRRTTNVHIIITDRFYHGVCCNDCILHVQRFFVCHKQTVILIKRYCVKITTLINYYFGAYSVIKSVRIAVVKTNVEFSKLCRGSR